MPFVFSSVFSPEHLLENLAARFGAHNVTVLSQDVIAVNTGNLVEVIQTYPDDAPVMDFTAFSNPVPSSRSILLHRPHHQKSDLSFAGWMESLRAFGYRITLTGELFDFEDALVELRPDIVGISATEFKLQEVGDAYRSIARLTPDAVAILGGYAAVKGAANFFDIVVLGEGDLIFPVLLAALHRELAHGKIRSDSEPPRFQRRRYLEEGVVERLKGLRALRIVPDDEEKLGHAEIVDIGSRIYVRGDASLSGEPFDFPDQRRAWAIPIGSVELKTMFSVPDDGEPASEAVNVYFQRGCKFDVAKRCAICSIRSPAGRSMAVKDAIGILNELAKRGVKYVAFGDDNFLGNHKWAGEFLRAFVESGLNKRIQISQLMARADSWTPELVLQMWDLGIQIAVGLETLDPKRAEAMGKVTHGNGEPYVDKGRKLIRLAGEYARQNSRNVDELLSLSMISIGQRDNLDDVLRDLKTQLTLIKEIKDEGHGIPEFYPHPTQNPSLSDNVTTDTLEDIYISGALMIREAGRINRRSFNFRRFDAGSVMVDFIPLVVDETDVAEGLIRLYSFKHGPVLEELIKRIEYIRSWPPVRSLERVGNLNQVGRKFFDSITLFALSGMRDSLNSYYGSKEKTDEVMRELEQLYVDVYETAVPATLADLIEVLSESKKGNNNGSTLPVPPGQGTTVTGLAETGEVSGSAHGRSTSAPTGRRSVYAGRNGQRRMGTVQTPRTTVSASIVARPLQTVRVVP